MAKYITVLPSAARTANVTTPNFHSYDDNDALHLVVDVTSGSPNLVVTVNGHDNASGKDYAILTGAIINGTGTTLLKVGPDYTAATNVAKDHIPAYWNVGVVQSGGVSATYSIGASLI